MPVFRDAYVVRIHVPVEAATGAALASGDGGALERDPHLAAIVALVRSDPWLGNFGLYDGVIEAAVGVESFHPSDAARPVAGSAGSVAAVPSVTLTLYAPGAASEAQIAATLDRILALHPWEVPVIEFTRTTLVGRSE